jgi:hypothetical protein
MYASTTVSLSFYVPCHKQHAGFLFHPVPDLSSLSTVFSPPSFLYFHHKLATHLSDVARFLSFPGRAGNGPAPFLHQQPLVILLPTPPPAKPLPICLPRPHLRRRTCARIAAPPNDHSAQQSQPGTQQPQQQQQQQQQQKQQTPRILYPPRFTHRTPTPLSRHASLHFRLLIAPPLALPHHRQQTQHVLLARRTRALHHPQRGPCLLQTLLQRVQGRDERDPHLRRPGSHRPDLDEEDPFICWRRGEWQWRWHGHRW